jgi:hypothetical protein
MVEEVNNRTATDILLSLENKIDILSRRISNIENLQKIISGRINDFMNKNPIKPKIKVSPGPDIIDKKLQEPIDNKEYNLINDSNKIINDVNNRIKVTQTLIEEEDRPLFLGVVEIYDENKKLITKTRTDSKGRWKASLIPGKYQLHVSKNYPVESKKKMVDISYNINVDSSSKEMNLSTLPVNDGDV